MSIPDISLLTRSNVTERRAAGVLGDQRNTILSVPPVLESGECRISLFSRYASRISLLTRFLETAFPADFGTTVATRTGGISGS